jgi:lysophospholipase L1-like esterase
LVFNASAVSMDRMTGGLIIYGDSIANGSGLDSPNTECYAMLTRDNEPTLVSVYGRGGLSLRQDSAAGTTSAHIVQSMYVIQPDAIWLAIGLNDYIQAAWNSTAFGTAYGQFLDRLHAMFPAADIFAASPGPVTSEGANGVGSTLPNYRSAISTACSTRAWSTFVDGTTIYTLANVTDGLHPDAAGHEMYADTIALFI